MRVLWLAKEDLYSTSRVIEESKKEGVDLTNLDVTDICFDAGGKSGVFSGGKNLVSDYDVLVVRAFHPFISEVLTLARLFKEAGKMVVDESLTDEGYAVSKMHDYLLLAGAGITVPRTFQVYGRNNFLGKCDELGYPIVLKGAHGSHGENVFRAASREQALNICQKYNDGELLAQEYLPAAEDFRVIVIGYRALPIIVLRRPRPGDFRTNVGLADDYQAASISDFPGIKKISQAAAKRLRKEFAGVDVRLKGGRPLVLEVNRRPSFDAFERVTGLNVPKEFFNYLKNRWSKF